MIYYRRWRKVSLTYFLFAYYLLLTNNVLPFLYQLLLFYPGK